MGESQLEPLASLRISQRTRSLAAQTKLLPPSARGEAWRTRSPADKARLAKRIEGVALREAAKAFANAQRARALLLARRAASGAAGDTDTSLPIVQLRVSAECFDPSLVIERQERQQL